MPSSIHQSESTPGGNSHRVAFDRFELDLRSGELRKDGRKIRLQAQPFQLLAMLIENAGELVTRDEVCRALWQADTFVDFDHSVSAAVNKIREALGDSVEKPRFVETLPKRGYRFIGKIKPEAPVVMAVAKFRCIGPQDGGDAGLPERRVIAPLQVAEVFFDAKENLQGERGKFGHICRCRVE